MKLSELWSIHRVDYKTVRKYNLKLYPTKWMNQTNTVGERSQSVKSTYCMIWVT